MAASFASILRREHVVTGIPGTERDDVLRAFLDRLVESGAFDAEALTTILRAVLKRERTGTTGIGRGVAIPHCKTAGVPGTIVAFGRTAEAVPYGSSDGDPVHSMFLVVSPPEAADAHVEILRSVAKFARDDYAVRVLRNTSDPASLFDLFRELDGKA